MSVFSSKSSRVSSLAKKFDPNVLQSQGTTDGETIRRSHGSSTDTKVDVLSWKIDRLLIIQETVLQKLDKVSQEVDELEKDIKKVKAEKASTSTISETEVKKCTSEMRKLCLDMPSALIEIRKHAEHQSKRLDGVEQIVMGIQQLLNFLAKKMKTSKALKRLFKSQGIPRSGIKNANLKNDKNKISFRIQSLPQPQPQKEDVLVKRENEKAIKDQKAKDKNEESSLEFKETKILTKKKLPGSTATPPKGYAQVPKEEEPELHLAAALDGTKDVLHKQQSHEEAKVHQKMVVQDVEKSQQALGSDKSHLKEEVIEEEEELEDEREDETVEEESESVLETDKEVKGDVGPDECQDQGIAAEDISKSSGGDRPGKELKPTKTVTEEFNKNSTQLLQRYDDGKENVPMSQRPNNEMSVEFLQGVGQNGCECAISSKRRVTEEDLVKDDSKKSKVEKEAAKNIVNSKTEDAPLISKDSPEVPDSLKDNQPEPSKVDKKPQILIAEDLVKCTNVWKKASGLTLAAKIIKARGLKEKEEVKNEIYVMNQLNHVNLLQLYDAFESKSDIVLIMEFVAGGELFDRIISENYNLTELDTILFIKQICEGIQYMHQMYFLHLDLKPENIMCVNQAANQIKIIDFGLARRYKPREKLKVNFGTPEFLAPEVVNYDFVSFPTDMWSIGVITYMLLSGLSPFLGEDDNETLNNIVACDWDFEDESFHDVSEEAKDFITKLLIKEKCWRISATETLKHPWLSDQKLRYRLGHQRKTKVSSVSRTPKTQ